jgi:hypothetical protein
MIKLTVDDLYELLDYDQLSLFIQKIVREKDGVIGKRITEDYEPTPYRHNHFVIIPGTVLILLRVGVDYWYETAVGLTYQVKDVARFSTRNEYEFYQTVYDFGDTKLIPKNKLNSTSNEKSKLVKKSLEGRRLSYHDLLHPDRIDSIPNRN